jgi:proteasome assembly chaperone (PAC2) family protein
MAKMLELELAECPTLRAPVLLAALAGWGDGAVAGTGALQYLVSKHGAQRLGTFDPDEIYQYTMTRPVTLRRESGERELVWPSLELYACPLPDSPRDVLILVGPEPDLRWRACADAILAAATSCGAQALVVVGSYWDRVTHLGAPQLSARAADAATREALTGLGLAESRYQGPTGFTSALLDACTRRGLPAAGLSARAPHYAQGIVHPTLSAALLETVERLHGVRFAVAELETAGREQARLLTQRLQQEPKLWQYVQQLAAEEDASQPVDPRRRDRWQVLATSESADAAPGTPPELPTGTEMVDAVEAFLRGGHGS